MELLNGLHHAQLVGNPVVSGRIFKKHAGDYEQPLEISHWEALSRIKSVLEWPMGATLKLESDKVVTAGSTLKVFTKLLDRLRGIGRGQEGI